MTRDWDAATYHRVSDSHQQWADALLARANLRGDETLLDAGCGTGRVTLKLLEALPRGRVIAVDGSVSMIERARAVLGDRAEVFQSDLENLTVEQPVDVVFSSAVFHWIGDHERLFARLHGALRPGGRLVAQCGGRGNIERFHLAAQEVAERAPYAEHLRDAPVAWNFAGAEESESRLRAAGFAQARCWLEPWPVRPAEPAAYVRAVCLGPQVERLPDELGEAYVRDTLAANGAPLVLDYVRLNIDAVRSAGV